MVEEVVEVLSDGGSLVDEVAEADDLIVEDIADEGEEVLEELAVPSPEPVPRQAAGQRRDDSAPPR